MNRRKSITDLFNMEVRVNGGMELRCRCLEAKVSKYEVTKSHCRYADVDAWKYEALRSDAGMRRGKSGCIKRWSRIATVPTRKYGGMEH